MKPTDDLVSECVRAIDAANENDPVRIDFEGRRAQWWVERLRPDAPPALRLAARAHHIRRWEVPRGDFPRDRAGYMVWRTHLYDFHADRLSEIMRTAGFQEDEIARSRVILHKKGIKTDPDVQVHEDAVSLAFLELRLAGFVSTVTDEQLMRALRRTWTKMSPAGREEARALVLSQPAADAIQAALE